MSRLPDIPTVPSGLEVPVEFSRLRDLAYNLRWTWSPRAHLLFAGIDLERWRHDHNPVQLLVGTRPPRWERLRHNAAFVDRYHEMVDTLDRYISGMDRSWFRTEFPDYQGGPVAYFSTEYGWHECLGIYSGGLGVLSGDHCKSASDLGVPFVGVGLMYQRGYFQQTVDADGRQQHFYPNFDLRRLPVLPVAGPDGNEIRVAVDLAGRTVHLTAWKATVGRVPVLLLDSNVPENDPADRPITSILYVRGREARLCQEWVLGVGGVRLLRALGISPSVWHMNEGHSALLAFERMREGIEQDGIPFDEALRRTLGNAVFTTHTPVAAGNETFEENLIRRYLEPMAARMGVGMDRLLDLGAPPGGRDGGFHLTALAVRSSSRTNGVSELHGRVADRLWRDLVPGGGRPESRRVSHVTNGVHFPTWIGPEIGELLQRHLGTRYDRKLLDPGFAEAVAAIPDEELWQAHLAQKDRLIQFCRERVQAQFARHGRSPGELMEVRNLLDPGALTIGFARRFATYKRAALIFRDRDRLRTLIDGSELPVQIVFAGKAHPADRPGQELIQWIFHASQSPEFRGRVVFLENYDMRVARFLVQGVELWLNTPRPPLEASGTSGMKVAANGGLNCSILDGWWCEGYDRSHGWIVGKPAGDGSDPERRDREDAESLYRVLEKKIVPTFYHRDRRGLPHRWIARMKRALGMLAPRFSADRMLREYVKDYYVPASRREGWGTEMDEVRLWSP